MTTSLPSFSDPPVVETILSVQFEPIPNFCNGHLGLFWTRVKSEYGVFSDAERVEAQFERFGDDQSRRPIGQLLRFVQASPAARARMASADGSLMIQLQHDRLLFNWLRTTEANYPTWERVRPRFDAALNELRAFVQMHELGPIQPNQWEVTYVNRLTRGREWQTLADLDDVVPGLIGRRFGPAISEVESLEAHWHLVLPERRGRLHIDFIHGYEGPTDRDRELLSLQLTARGPIEGTSGQSVEVQPEAGLDRGLEVGHTAIVRTFVEMTGPKMHDLWGFKR